MSAKGTVRQALKQATPYWIRRLARRAANPLVDVFYPPPPPPPDTPEIAALRRQVKALPWFHSMYLGHGIHTPGQEPTVIKLHRLGMPWRLTGKTVLDIGAYDGFFSFEAERRGAARVLATDCVCWGGQDSYGVRGNDNRPCFDLAHRALRSRVEARTIDLFDLSPQTVGRFDLVLFLGVLYHMRHPLLALERVAAVTADMLILETHVDMLDCRRPAMAFYPGTEINNDPTNWCGPNPAMVKLMLKKVGFRKVRLHGDLFRGSISRRAVFHAWR